MKRIENPKVSIIMSVYNGENYLKEAIDSILNQTFKDFEFIIINDGSTDKSLRIIKSYKDPRIVLISRANRGLAKSLNEGIKKAKGEYIARMDADDISKKDRLQKQISFLGRNKDVSLVVTTVELIDQNGDPIQHVWVDDRKAITPKQIEDSMPISDCIAHPTVFAISKLYKDYQYNDVRSGEDYDLWLRILSDGFKIAKIDDPLLSYRIHEESITLKSNKNGSARKVIYIKENFLVSQIKLRKWGKIEKKVLKSLKSDYLNYYSELIGKNYIKYPFKALRKAVRILIKIKKISPFLRERKIIKNFALSVHSKNNKKNVLFILPWMTVGGADKVALDIASGLQHKFNWHFITTEIENDNSWHKIFQEVTKNIVHISDFIIFQSNKSYYIYKYCKNNNIDTIIISNSISGYRALPIIKRRLKNIRIIDILHGEGGNNDNGGAPKFMQPFETQIDLHITVTEYLKKYLIKTYKNSADKIKVIHNGVDTEFYKPSRGKPTHNRYNNKNIIWIGRFSEEKNPLEFAKLAKNCIKLNLNFIMAGTGPLKPKIDQYKIENSISNLNLIGEVNNSKKLLATASLLVMTSSMEGLPIVLLESGAMGVPALCPNVGGISEYIKINKNGLMHSTDEQLYKNLKQYPEGKISFWNADRIRKNVVENYSIEKMLDEYKKII